jgi:GNAT superfamily N-acetyltransferase
MIRIRPMSSADIPLGMRLKAEAGWNQTEADWCRFLWLQPDGCFVAELDGAEVGTTTTCIFGSVAWVAMVLVDQAVRGRGIGMALMRHALAFLDGRGVPTVCLDATALGRPLYEKLGFTVQHTLHRYEGIPPELIDEPLLTTTLQPSDWHDVLALDLRASGAPREAFLRRLHEEGPDTFRVLRREGRLLGIVAWRPGAFAYHVGPCLVSSWEAGGDLLIDAFRCLAGRPIVIDVPEQRNHQASTFVDGFGLTAQRPLLRMSRGEPVRENLDLLWASSGPEKG